MTFTRREFLKMAAASPSMLTHQEVEDSLQQRRFAEKNSFSGPAEAWIELSRKNINYNLKKIQAFTHKPVMGVIKANAYGHGLLEFAECLQSAGVHSLMVCSLREAVFIRASGISIPILNFGPFFPNFSDILLKNRITQSIFTNDILHLSKTANKQGLLAKIHIHVDTGMGRMGIPYHKALPFINKTAALPGLTIKGVSSTLTEDEEFDQIQYQRLTSLINESKKKGVSLGVKHLASSAAIFSSPSLYLDMIRPGIVLYGYYPNQKTQKEDLLSLKPVLQLKSRVAAVKNLRPGDSVSYHRAYVATKKETIAVIPVGYSDGYPFNIIGKGKVLIKGKRIHLIGDITANHLIVRIDSCLNVRKGDEVVLIGYQGKEHILADEIADWAGVSTYKILIRLNPLLPNKIV